MLYLANHSAVEFAFLLASVEPVLDTSIEHAHELQRRVRLLLLLTFVLFPLGVEVLRTRSREHIWPTFSIQEEEEVPSVLPLPNCCREGIL